MLALAIISILIMAATRYFHAVTLSQRINIAQMQILDIMQALKHWKAKYGNYNDLKDNGMGKLGGLIAHPIKDPFGAKTGWAIDPQPDGTVTIRLNGITEYECNKAKERLSTAFRPPLELVCNVGDTVTDLLILYFE
jgi:hypothetical protein